jgi:hypothetical protein
MAEMIFLRWNRLELVLAYRLTPVGAHRQPARPGFSLAELSYLRRSHPA